MTDLLKRVHIVGASHPVVSYILLHFVSLENFVPILYSSKICVNKRFVYNTYSSLPRLFASGDILLSISPPFLSAPLVQAIVQCDLLPSLVVQLSSTSIYSKVQGMSPDSLDYTHFVLGENNLITSLLPFAQVKLCILRLSMLWGSGDKNITRIRKLLLSYKCFPLLKTQATLGLRAPIHCKQLSFILAQIIFSPPSSGVYDLMGPQILSYDQMFLDIASTIRFRVFPLAIPVFYLVLLLRLAVALRLSRAINVISMVLRQRECLVYSKNPLPSSFLNLPPGCNWRTLLDEEFS